MAENIIKDNMTVSPHETTLLTGRVIRLDPVWSDIEGLSPPLAADAIALIRKERVLQDALIRPQYDQILDDAQDRFMGEHNRGIGFRSIMVSNEGTVHLQVDAGNRYDIPDMQSVLERGTELPQGDLLVSRQEIKDEPSEDLRHLRVFQYLTNGVNHILNAKDPAAKQKLTPAILVYDLSQLQQKDSYRHILSNPLEADNVILALYPVNIEPAK